MTREKAKGRRSFYGAAGILAGGTFLSRILGLAREQVFAYFFGAGVATDAFQIAFRIPNLLRDLFAEGAMSSALVPVYTTLRQEEGEERAWALVRNVVTTLALFLSLVAFVGILCADPLVSLFAPAFRETPGKHELTVGLTRVLWPFLPMVVMAAVWMGILNARERYATPALAPSVFNLASIVAAFTLTVGAESWFGLHPIYGMALGATLGGLGQWWIQVPSLRKEGFRFLPEWNLRDPALRRMLALMGAGTFGLAATQINVFVNSVLASGEGDGAVSWLNYAFRLMYFPIGVFGVAIATVNLTKVSQFVARKDFTSVRDSIRDSLRMVFVLTVPSAVGLAVLGIPIISVIYEHGRFTPEDTYATSMALAAYALGLTAYSGIKVLVPVLYSLGKAKAAVWSSGLGVVTNVVLCFGLVGVFSFKGLALAASVSALFNLCVLLVLVERNVKQIDFKNLFGCLFKTLLASLFMAIFVYIPLYIAGIMPFEAIPLTSWWAEANFSQHLLFLVAALLLGGVSYAIAGRVLGLHEIEKIQGLLWKRLNKRRDQL